MDKKKTYSTFRICFDPSSVIEKMTGNKYKLKGTNFYLTKTNNIINIVQKPNHFYILIKCAAKYQIYDIQWVNRLHVIYLSVVIYSDSECTHKGFNS